MGTLHEIYQIEEKVILGGAYIKIKDSCEKEFENLYESYIHDKFSRAMPHNSRLQWADGKKIMRGPNQSERVVKVRRKGIYLLIFSGTKSGFEDNFRVFLEAFSESFEDFRFFAIWDYHILEYRLENGIFTFIKDEDHNYNFVNFFTGKYGDAYTSSLLLEELERSKGFFDYEIEVGENPYRLYDRNDLTEFKSWLDRIDECEEKRFLDNWLNEVLRGLDG